MKRYVSGACLLLGLAVVLAGAMAADPAKPKVTQADVPKDILDKVTKALPEKASAKPVAKRKLLACIKSVGFRHDSIPVCAKALELMGTKTGAWETVISDDLGFFEPENLKEFDGVFFCVTTGEIFGTGPTEKMANKEEAAKFARYRKSLLEFVASGKGVGGNHGAADACYTWPEWGEMLGAYFTEHPFGRIVVKNDDPKSPVNTAFNGKDFPFNDEMYVFGPKPQRDAKQPYSRDKLHVLLSIDAEASKLPKKARDDQDYAISWIKSYDKGRVFYCSFGHGREIYTHPFILQHFQDGVQFLLGDLKADTSPSGKASLPSENKDVPKKDATEKKTATEEKKVASEKPKPAEKPKDATATPKDAADKKSDVTEKKDLVHAAGAAAPGVLVIRVNCGAKEDYTDLSGVVWSADQMYGKEKKWGASDGATASRQGVTLPTTDAPGIYLCERYNLKNYRFDVPAGKYTVRVHLCETWEGASKPGVRSFGVKVQNDVVLKDFNLVSEVGFMKPYVKEVKDVVVTDGKLIVEFIHPAVHQHPFVDAIEVIGQQEASENAKPADKPKAPAAAPEKKDTPEKKKDAPEAKAAPEKKDAPEKKKNAPEAKAPPEKKDAPEKKDVAEKKPAEGDAAKADEWKLVFSDEFDKPGLPDPEKWAYEEGYLNKNNEKQYYTKDRKENARVEDGKLILEARRDQFPIAGLPKSNNRKVAEYTSASLTSKQSWTYGKIEVKAKLPTGKGMWPAIWMLGDNIKKGTGWPACGEIDIMENVGFDPDTIHSNMHTLKYNHTKKTNKGDKITIAKPYEDFHVYAVEWHPDRIDSFVDGKKYFTFQNEKTGNDAWPFDKPEYLILNIAIGGDWGGQKGIDNSIFPQKMEIKYVKIYQKKQQPEK